MASVTADARVCGVYDKGEEKGAIIQNEVVVKDCEGDKIVTIVSSIFARGGGGFGGPSEGMPSRTKYPAERRTDQSISQSGTTKHCSIAYRVIEIPCTAIRNSRGRRDFPSPFSTACATMD